MRLLTSSHIIVAHNAAFDRKFVERRLPSAAGLPWACTLQEIDWAASGFEGKALGWLACQKGVFFDAHRASADVDAVIALLSHLRPDGKTLLSELVERSSRPVIRIEAAGAHFDLKDVLYSRGYHWDAAKKCWFRELPECGPEVEQERDWLASNVYGPECRARRSGPQLIRLTARERYA